MSSRTEYDSATREHQGHHFRVGWHYDPDHEEPWNDGDGRGIVSEWTLRAKRPGERIVASEHTSHRYFDWEATMAKAKAEGWGTKQGGPGDYAGAVELEFQRIRAWCRDEWHYCGVEVTLLDPKGCRTQYSAALWGLESDDTKYQETVIRDLAEDVLAEAAKWEPCPHCHGAGRISADPQKGAARG